MSHTHPSTASSSNFELKINNALDTAKVIFAGVGVLLSAAKDVREGQDTLVDIFERMEMFLFRRLEVYTQPTAELMDIIIQIVVEVTSILGIATKEFSSIRPLPTPSPPPKGRSPTINTHDIEQNSIAELRKRFEYANAEALEGFLADLSEYEEKKQYHAKTNVFEDQHAVLVSTWTHVARRRSDAKVEDKDEKTLEVTARDIRLAYALEVLFEKTPKTVEELNGHTGHTFYLIVSVKESWIFSL
ncbi:hypothetical protein F5888DRAFT_1800565 [Russula emetica]|nr:hypothetical protein F5888DRAFT_1800565 [Russula emetica]